MKLSRLQPLVASPQWSSSHHLQTHEHVGGEAANLSSSSSSSLTSTTTATTNLHSTASQNLVATPTHHHRMTSGSTSSVSHQHLPRMSSSSHGLRHYQRNLSMSAQMTNTAASQPMPVVAAGLSRQAPNQYHQHSHHHLSAASPVVVGAGSSSLSSSQVYLMCNKCSKMLTTVTSERLNGSSSSHQLTAITGSATTATFNLSSSLTGSGPASNMMAGTSVSKEAIINTANEPNLIGCLNCAHFLPQCTICLRMMKINLLPVSQHSKFYKNFDF